jgi:hypothetical protein
MDKNCWKGTGFAEKETGFVEKGTGNAEKGQEIAVKAVIINYLKRS